MGEFLFRFRGPILAVPLLVALTMAEPTPRGFVIGTTGVFLGLAVRLWAIMHIGPAARTRDPRPPDARVVTGPYRVRHPLYLANVWLAASIGVASGLRAGLLAGLIFGIACFYAALAVRESMSSRGLPVESRPRLSWVSALRVERSTILTVCLCSVLLLARLAD